MNKETNHCQLSSLCQNLDEMYIGFLPGQPNPSANACSFANWNTIQILAYTSGNNLVILTKNSKHLQTIYLPQDSDVIDINKANGKIAIAIKNQIYIYTPQISNFYNFNFHGRKNLSELKIEWVFEHIITNENDDSSINCLSWSDYSELADSDIDSQFLDLPPEFNSKTMCELVTGSNNSLTMHNLSYITENNEKIIKCKLLWYKKQPNPVYKVRFSPNATCIASIGYYDCNVKLWHRLGFNSDFSDFELRYLKHENYVTDIIWKKNISNLESISNQNSRTGSTQMTPSNSFLLKPANSIIKTDRKLINSETDSIFSTTTKETQHNALYTITSDSILRVFSTYKLDRGFEIINSGSLDLFDGEPEKRTQNIIKSVTFIDNPYLELGLEKLLNDLEVEHSVTLNLGDTSKKQAKLLSFIRTKCELCMVIGSDGFINLYGLTNLSNPSPVNMSIFKINKLSEKGQSFLAKVKLNKFCLPTVPTEIILKSIQINHYSDNLALTLVIHDMFKNTIREVGFTFDELFQFERENVIKDSRRNLDSKVKLIGELQQKFTGHNKSVRRLIRSADGSTVLSLTRFNENFIWSPIYLGNNRSTLTKKSKIITPSPVIDASIWENGNFVFTLIQNKLLCYKCDSLLAVEVCYVDLEFTTIPSCMFLLPESSKHKCHLVMIFKDGTCKAYEFHMTDSNDNFEYFLNECLIDDLPKQENNDYHIISPIDPVGWKKSIDNPDRDVLATVSKTGLVYIYYAFYREDDNSHKILWHLKDSFKTGIKNCSFISCSSISKLAIVDESRSQMTLWDMKVGMMDYEETFEDEVINDLDWTSTDYDQGILSVGFKSYCLLYTQLRYDYTNVSLSFAKIKKVDISDQTTHEIGDSIWMKDGLQVIGSGNQLYISDKKLDSNNDIITNKAIGTLEIVSNDLFHLCCALNGPLPFYHPQFIIQLLLSGRHDLISKILVKFSKVLRDIDLGKRKEDDFYFDLKTEDLLSNGEIKSKNLKSYKNLLDAKMDDLNIDEVDPDNIFSEQCADILIEKLQKIRLPFLTGHQQITLSHTVTIMKDVLLKYVNVLDFNGIKFYLSMKLFTVNMGKEIAQNTTKSIRMRDITFALHSDNKDLLYNIVNEQAGMRIDWLNAKRYGLPYWMELSALTRVIEKIAANEFLKFQDENSGMKDPSVCSIFYLILKKKKVLLGLWKNSIGHSERDKMVKFLSNDFTQARWKSAALKNAYVLLGKHRYRDAATFFLLADAPKDAVNVIMRQMKDVSLAVAVARCYEGIDNSPSMKIILEREILNNSIETNNRWKLSWVFWILGKKSLAAQSLIKPLHYIKYDVADLLPDFKWPDVESVIRTRNTEDPVLLIMYDSLRNRNIEYLKGIYNIKPEHEFDFVLKAANMYEKMGCDWLALYLVGSWKFSSVDKSVKNNLVLSDIDSKVTETDNHQRKRPGDILAKFMNNSTESANKNSIPPSNNMLDSFSEPKQAPNMLDSFIPTQAPNLLDSFSSSATPSMLDSFSSIPTPNLLDSFTPSVPNAKITKEETNGESVKDTSKSDDSKQSIGSATRKKTTAIPNMLDNWA